jgi:glycosyltransferase involved in cell wall biosynthesis
MYPKNENLYRNAFIHKRVLEYMKRGLDIDVFVLDETLNERKTYTFENVKVIEGNKFECRRYIDHIKPKKILVHFINRHIIDVLKDYMLNTPIIVWIHLVEATAWYRRLFNITDKSFPKYVLQNTRQLLCLRSFIKRAEKHNIHFIFVSNWVKQIAEKDMLIKINNNYHIINNVIDTKIFKYQPKSEDLRKKILLIRPFESKKYANDIAVKAILELRKRSFFNDLEITIFGKGKLFYKTVKPIMKFPNVKVHNNFLTHNEIKKQHDLHGIFLCPTRQDSQGVSMCEAMSSGLVPITTNNSAIPEFVEHNKTGILTNSPQEIAGAIEYLYRNPGRFRELSISASKWISKNCGPEQTIEKELKIILNP